MATFRLTDRNGNIEYVNSTENQYEECAEAFMLWQGDNLVWFYKKYYSKIEKIEIRKNSGLVCNKISFVSATARTITFNSANGGTYTFSKNSGRLYGRKLSTYYMAISK